MRIRLGRRSHDEHLVEMASICREEGYDLTDSDDFDLFWDRLPPESKWFRLGSPEHRYSHVWGVGELSIKSRLDQNLCAQRFLLGETGERLYDFFPRAFHMPEDYDELVATAAEEPGTLWMQKPKWLSRGRGIEVITDLATIPRGNEWMVQEYIAWPHLLDGHKYTLRFYVLIASLDPLVVYLYDQGFCKFTSRPFRLDEEGLKDRFAHLTNPDVLRDDPTVPTSSRNLTHAAYRARLRQDGIDDAALWSEIERLVALTVLAARGSILRRHRNDKLDPRVGFELMGFDVMVDEDHLPWLLECNLLPSLEVEADATTPSAIDERNVKRSVMRDLVRFFAAGEAAPEDAGGFHRVLPARRTGLLAAYGLPRVADLALWSKLYDEPPPVIRVLPDDVVVERRGARALLRDRATDRTTQLDEAQSLIWYAIGDGAEVGALARQFGVDVWSTLADWVDVGLLRRSETPVVDYRPTR